jgi:hypothetical protein
VRNGTTQGRLKRALGNGSRALGKGTRRADGEKTAVLAIAGGWAYLADVGEHALDPFECKRQPCAAAQQALQPHPVVTGIRTWASREKPQLFQASVPRASSESSRRRRANQRSTRRFTYSVMPGTSLVSTPWPVCN